MQEKLGSRKEVFLHGAGYSTVYPLSGGKADNSLPAEPERALWGKALGHRVGQAETNNVEVGQKQANCKPLSRVGMCYQQ